MIGMFGWAIALKQIVAIACITITLISASSSYGIMNKSHSLYPQAITERSNPMAELELSIRLIAYTAVEPDKSSYADIYIDANNLGDTDITLEVTHMLILCSDTEKLVLDARQDNLVNGDLEPIQLPNTRTISAQHTEQLQYRISLDEHHPYPPNEPVKAEITYRINGGTETVLQSKSTAVATLIP